MKMVLFVCTANICRSPMAAGIFNALVQERDLPFRSESVGVAALVGKPAAPYACQAADELGIDLDGHRARQVDKAVIQAAELVLTMTLEHQDTLYRNFGDVGKKFYTLPEYSIGDETGGIADPYGHGPGVYRSSARQILRHIELVVERLERECGETG